MLLINFRRNPKGFIPSWMLRGKLRGILRIFFFNGSELMDPVTVSNMFAKFFEQTCLEISLHTQSITNVYSRMIFSLK